MNPHLRRALTVGLFLCVALVSWTMRTVAHGRIDIPGDGRWITSDPDSLYHMRRVSRALEDGMVAPTDPFLDYPNGAIVPWPSYYTRMLVACMAPFEPEGEFERYKWIEGEVASMPRIFGTATSVLIAGAGWMLGGPALALGAGLYHACSVASIQYSKLGNGDHHAWISFLMIALLCAFCAGVARGALERPRSAAAWGALMGFIAGIMLGSWVASLLYVLGVQLALAWLLFVNTRRPLPGLCAFGTSFHLVALLVLWPAVLESPWRIEYPWMVVNLSWFHPLLLALGALVFVPLPFLRSTGFVRARYPWIVGGVLAALGLVCALLPFGPGPGIREGFDWVSRTDAFMATITESKPLLGAGMDDEGKLFEYLGDGVWLILLAWPLLARASVKAGAGAWRSLALVPWTVAIPLLAMQAAGQRRFADALCGPLGLALMWMLMRLWEERSELGEGERKSGPFAKAPRWQPIAIAVVLACAGHWRHIVSPVGAYLIGVRETGPSKEQVRSLGRREMAEWIRQNTPRDADYSVLANWAYGHMLEWAAERPTISTNFGSYLGEDSLLDSGRFFFMEDPAAAEALLERRRARYVMVSSNWPKTVGAILPNVDASRWGRYVDAPLDGRGPLRQAWFETIGARLMFDGRVHDPRLRQPGPALDFLRLVHPSQILDPEPELQGAVTSSPCGWVWERVPGARLEMKAQPGQVLAVQIRVQYGDRYTLDWRHSVTAGADGIVRMRVPYATVGRRGGRNGSGLVSGTPVWKLSARSGELIRQAGLMIPGVAVLEGRTIQLR